MENSKLFIGGKWINGTSGTYIDVENPATHEIIGRVPEGNETDVNLAVEAAKKALPGWKETLPAVRSEYLLKIADYLEEHADDISKTITAELGAPVSMVKGWHVDGSIGEAKFFAKYAREFAYEVKFDGLIVRREPVGIVAGLTPWNFPLDQLTVKVLPAIAAGNCVIIKPSQIAPLTSYHFAYAAEAVGLPAGVFNLVTGRGGEVGNVLASHRDIRMVSFTGSTTGGREVGRLALGNIKKIALELGGKSACVVLQGADYQKAVDVTLPRCFMNSGQICCAPTRMLVPRQDQEQIEQMILKKAASFKIGDPLDPSVDIGPIVSRKQLEKVKYYIELGLKEGARMLFGEVPDSSGKDYYVKPVVFTDVDNSMRIAQEEIFGPVLCVIPYDTEKEAEQIANDSPYGLSGAVFGVPAEAKAFSDKMETGVVLINGAPFTYEAPFGGYKQSGLGRENGPFGFGEYLEIKSVTTNEPIL